GWHADQERWQRGRGLHQRYWQRIGGQRGHQPCAADRLCPHAEVGDEVARPQGSEHRLAQRMSNLAAQTRSMCLSILPTCSVMPRGARNPGLTCHSERSEESRLTCHSERSEESWLTCHSERSEESSLER